MMKPKTLLFLLLAVIVSSCSKTIDYTSDYMQQTSGRYLYNPDEVIDVFYKNKKLFLRWKGAENIEPVIIDDTTFFVVDMYKKLRFVKHPETQERYLAIVSEVDESLITYDYLKVQDSFKTPSMHLKSHNYDKALAGFLDIKKQDSTSVLLDESEFNRMGYDLLGDKDYEHAIGVFKMNVALYPESDNVYDSLADAYLRSGDSLEAFNNYKIALELNTRNRRAKRYVEAYNKK